MKTKSCVGIHYTNRKITVTLVEKQGSEMKITPPRYIFSENDGPADTTERTSLISKLASDLKHQYKPIPSVAISLAGNFYQSQFHHSEFENSHQIDQTLHYDIEEEFAIDAESIALCYQNSPYKDSGSNLIIHTVARNKLGPLLEQLDEVGLDAMVAEPDITTWQSFLHFSKELPNNQGCVVVGCSSETIYILILDKDHKPLLTRTFPAPAESELYTILRCELTRNLGGLDDQQMPPVLLYHSESIDVTEISNIARELDLRCQKLSEPDVITACAVGVAIGFLDNQVEADFRSDNLPPRTLTVAYRKAIYTLSCSVCVLLLAWIVNMGVSASRHSKIKARAEDDIRKAWFMTYHNDNYPVDKKETEKILAYEDKQRPSEAALIRDWKKKYPNQDYPVNKNRIKQMLKEKKQETNEKYSNITAIAATSDSTTHTLLLMLNVINKIPDGMDLRIKNLILTPKAINSFSGTVSNLQQLMQLRSIIEAPGSQLVIDRSTFEASGTKKVNDPANRSSFSMPLRVSSKVKNVEDEK